MLQKIFILFFSLLLTLIKTENTSDPQAKLPVQIINYSVNIDSLKENIKKNGWNNKYLMLYHFYVVNSADITGIKEDIKDIPSGTESSFMNSLILKKEQKYNEMFDTLYSSFSEKVTYLPFYEELVFSASAAGRIDFLKKKITETENLQFREYILGLICLNKNENSRAAELFELSLKEDSTKGDIFYQLSYAYRYCGEYAEALKISEKALYLFPDDKWLRTRLSLANGSLYFFSGNYNEAFGYYKKGLDLASENSDVQNEAKAYINLGILEDISGNVEKSREYISRARDLCILIHDFETLALAYSELGVSYTYTNNIIEAEKNYLESKAIYERTNNRNRLSLLLNNLGNIYLNLFDYSSALEYFEKGFEHSGDNKRSQALNLTGIASVYVNLSNYSKAVQYYKKAKEISSEINDISLKAEIDSDLGSLNFNLNRFNNAVLYYSSARNYAAESDDAYLLTDLNHKIGLSYLELDSLDNAEKHFCMALASAEKNSIPYYQALVLIDLADVQREKKDYKNALVNLHSARIIAEKNSFDYLLARGKLTEGEIAAESREFKNAESLMKRALEISRELHEFNLQTEANYKLAKLFEENNFPEAAESFYKSALQVIEDVSRPLLEESEVQIAYFSAQKEVYDSFAEFYLKRERFSDAFELIERSRSRNTVQNIKNLKLESLVKDSLKLKNIYDWEWIIHSGIYSSETIDSVRYLYDKLKQSLISENPGLEKYLAAENFLTLKEIQNNLDPDENLLSFYSTNDKTYIFLLRQEDFKHFVTDYGREELLNHLEKISPYLNRGNEINSVFYNQDLFSFNSEEANNFYRIFLEKVLKEIPEEEKIIVSPSAELVSLPFDFLVISFNEEQSSYDYSNSDFLIYHYNFSYTPSAAVFIQQKNNNLINDDKILIAGNPEIADENTLFAERRGLLGEAGSIRGNITLFPLKYSEEEIVRINNLIDADKVLTDRDANETEFRKNSELAKIVHLSTHSFLFNRQPVIFFSNIDDKENDGFLELGEIVQLQLNSDLVVLSSCNSGLGNIDAAEGIIGMTKAFFEAGSKSIVVSLWEVNDRFTSELMTLFYEKLSEGYDKDEALRYSKIDFIKEFSPNPYFWGAFIISGNTDRIDIKKGINTHTMIAGTAVIIIFIIILMLKKKIKGQSNSLSL